MSISISNLQPLPPREATMTPAPMCFSAVNAQLISSVN